MYGIAITGRQIEVSQICSISDVKHLCAQIITSIICVLNFWHKSFVCSIFDLEVVCSISDIHNVCAQILT
jgi:hypothetical protein